MAALVGGLKHVRRRRRVRFARPGQGWLATCRHRAAVAAAAPSPGRGFPFLEGDEVGGPGSTFYFGLLATSKKKGRVDRVQLLGRVQAGPLLFF